MNVGIVGCGRMGLKRAAALGDHPLVAVADVARERATALAAAHPECRAEDTWERVIGRADVEAVIVATTHDVLAPVAAAAVRAGKHVLVEKPGARSAAELETLARAVRERGAVVKVGFNHRYHPALARAKALADDGAVGDLLYVRGRYGHGGRPGYETEWRADPAVSGGGELLDQGVHLIDLSRWFLGDFANVTGRTATYFWKMPVEDNAFLVLETARGQVAWLHASWTEWKNLFSLEVFGATGKLQVDGLGGSYGTERLTWYRMRPELGPPETTTWEYPGADDSWRAEFADFAAAVAAGDARNRSLDDARAALAVVDAVYGRTAP